MKSLTAGLLIFAGFADSAPGATNGVVLGQNFQSVIDTSAPGDTIVVQPGVYSDASLVFNKSLTVLPSGTNGDLMQFTGTIQVTGAGASSFQRAYFANSVEIIGSTISFFDTRFNGAFLRATGGKITMKRTTVNSPFTLSNNAALEALRLTNNADLFATATAGSGAPFLAVQSWFSDNVILSGYKVWLGYNNFVVPDIRLSNLRQTNCDSVLIGNYLTCPASSPSGVSVIYQSGGTFKAYNNLIRGDTVGSPWHGINLNSVTGEVVNNTVRCGGGGTAQNSLYRGIQANAASFVILRANVISLDFNLYGGNGCNQNIVDVEATGTASQTVFASYCDLLAQNTSCSGGTVAGMAGVAPPPVNCLVQVNPNLASDGTPNPGSPCINSGPPEPIYNNRDGTRNTIGYTGGPYWNPANYTNSNPMVFLLTGQQMAIKGVQTSIPISVGASAGH